jgi:segregation and condensation protein A
VVPDADYRIKLQVFEGPLDLLLFLIRKNELDIYDIPIESVTKQYIEALRAMQQLDLDVAGEFFVMAATLMEIKSRMLLPKGQHAIDPNADDEEVDPRWELVHQLLQYKKFKEAAVKLAELVETRQNLMERHVSTLAADLVERPLKSVDRIELWNSFNIVLRRLAEKLVVGEIHDEVVTVSDQMEWLLEQTQRQKSFVFSTLFPDGVTLRRLVATFLAMLELTRLKKLRIRQTEAFADIIFEPVEVEPLPVAETAALAVTPSEFAVAPADPAEIAADAAVIAAMNSLDSPPSELPTTSPLPTEEPPAATFPAEATLAPSPAAEPAPEESEVACTPPPPSDPTRAGDVATEPPKVEKPLETQPNPPTVSA